MRARNPLGFTAFLACIIGTKLCVYFFSQRIHSSLVTH